MQLSLQQMSYCVWNAWLPAEVHVHCTYTEVLNVQKWMERKKMHFEKCNKLLNRRDNWCPLNKWLGETISCTQHKREYSHCSRRVFILSTSCSKAGMKNDILTQHQREGENDPDVSPWTASKIEVVAEAKGGFIWDVVLNKYIILGDQVDLFCWQFTSANLHLLRNNWFPWYKRLKRNTQPQHFSNRGKRQEKSSHEVQEASERAKIKQFWGWL